MDERRAVVDVLRVPVAHGFVAEINLFVAPKAFGESLILGLNCGLCALCFTGINVTSSTVRGRSTLLFNHKLTDIALLFSRGDGVLGCSEFARAKPVNRL